MKLNPNNLTSGKIPIELIYEQELICLQFKNREIDGSQVLEQLNELDERKRSVKKIAHSNCER